MAEYPLAISAGSFSDSIIFTACNETSRFLDGISRISWESVSRNPLSQPEGKRTENCAKPMRMGTTRVHANPVYDFTKFRLPPVQHGGHCPAFFCTELLDFHRKAFEISNRKQHTLRFSTEMCSSSHPFGER